MDWNEFFSMGGRGFYVWGSYGVTALFLIIELIALRHRKKQIHKRIIFSANAN